MEDNGFVFFIGLVVISIATGSQFGSVYGFYVLGTGFILVSLLNYLNGGAKFQDVDNKRNDKG